MKLKRPGKFYWDIQSPNPQTLVTNGTTLWNYEPDLIQVTIQTITQDFYNSPAALLTENAKTLNNYHITTTQPNTYQLIPKDTENQHVEKLRLHIKNQSIQQLEIWDALDNYTIITLTNITTNQQIPDQTFEFTPPEGTDIINNE